MTTASRDVLEAVKQQRVNLAASVIVAILLVLVFRAPLLPVVAGCLLSLVYLVLRSRARASSGRAGR